MALQAPGAYGRPRETATGAKQWAPLPGFGEPRHEEVNADAFLTPLGQDAIAEAYRAGLGVSITKTSDGGACSLTVYDGESRYRSYAGHVEEAESMWEALGAFARSKMPVRTTQPLETLLQAPQAKNEPKQRPAQKLPASRTRSRK